VDGKICPQAANFAVHHHFSILLVIPSEAKRNEESVKVKTIHNTVRNVSWFLHPQQSKAGRQASGLVSMAALLSK